MNTEQFIEAVNNLRRTAKGWYQWTGTVNGKAVELKGYKTWLQIFRVNGLHNGGVMDISVTNFKQTLKEAVE